MQFPILEFFKELDKTTMRFVSAFQQITEATNKIAIALNRQINSEQLQESLKKIGQGLIETEKDLIVFKYAMVELGYPPHDGLSIQQMRNIAQNYSSDSSEVMGYINDFMTEFYSPEEMKQLLFKWEKSQIIKKRLPLLRNAVMAHNLGMYDLVVPSILSQFEGYLVDLFGIKGRVDGKILKILLKYLLLQNMDFESSFRFDDAIHKYYSEQILENFEHGKIMKYDISRHAILHGANTDFGKQTTSLKVLLLFDFLHGVAEELTKESISEAKKEIQEHRRRGNNRKRR